MPQEIQETDAESDDLDSDEEKSEFGDKQVKDSEGDDDRELTLEHGSLAEGSSEFIANSGGDANNPDWLIEVRKMYKNGYFSMKNAVDETICVLLSVPHLAPLEIKLLKSRLEIKK